MSRLGAMTRLHAYVLSVIVVGTGLLCWIVVRDLPLLPSAPWLGIALLAAGVALGEMTPVRVGRVGRATSVTFSGGFALALLLIAPLTVALLIQLAFAVFDDTRTRQGVMRSAFNVAQYVVTFYASSTAFFLVTGTATLHGHTLEPRELLGILAAGAMWFVANYLLVYSAVALYTRQPLHAVLFDGNFLRMTPYAIDVALAPVAIAVLQYSPLLLPLLMLPPLVMHHASKLAAMREHEALHDVLTGLPNRALLRLTFNDRVPEVQAGRYGLAVMLIDLDHFKDINDTLGHHVGDLLLCEVARRLQAAIRDGDLVARLGGDEFAILARTATGGGRQEATLLADRLVAALEEPVMADGVRLDVQGSIGIALAPEHGESAEILMSRADIALYVAKEHRGCAAFYDPTVDERTPQKLSLLGELRDGIDRGELELHYQPKLGLATGEVVGVEALVRWRHPQHGLLSAVDFVPLAESTGLVVPMTFAVLDLALRQQRLWLDRGLTLGVSVNVSVRHLTDLSLPQQIQEILLGHGVPAGMLTLEVTETTIMTDPTRSAVVISRLRDIGVHISVDDYGTGYSSLDYLRRLEVDELKIDRSFIAGMTGAGNDEVIVRSTIELGHNLGLVVVAEGVEDPSTLQMLARLSCDVAQGYLLSRPLPAAELDAWLLARRESCTGILWATETRLS